MKKLAITLVVASAALLVAQQDAQAGGRKIFNRWGERFAQTQPWHGDYTYTPYGQHTGLVVPPTATMQTTMGWGVTQNSMRPIYHQYARPFPGPVSGVTTPCYPTPRWPSHTDQFGVYYIRGPW